jgi:hypothetical protein
MKFRLGDWVNHSHFGNGQIIENFNSSFVIRFIAEGKKKITKEFPLTPGNPPSSGTRGNCFTCKDVFPFIQEVIERLCQQFGEAEHDAIVDKLMRHPEASGIIDSAVVRCSHFSKREIASNMVQWMSQHYTEGHADADVFAESFQRHKDSRGRWVYSLR